MDFIDPLSRTIELDDLTVRTEGDAREIDAYAAVFDTPTEIYDHEGHYWEKITRSAFDRTLAQRGTRFKVLFNHGRDIFGQPSERFALPIGVPVEMRSDERGLFTRTKISRTDLGDEILELARDGAITGFSFRAQAIQTKRHPKGTDGLPTYERSEFRLLEYGPGVFVAYDDAQVLAVRTQNWLDNLTAEERSHLLQVLAGTPDGSPHGSTDPAAPGDSETPDDWRADAMRAVLAFDLKDLT